MGAPITHKWPGFVWRMLAKEGARGDCARSVVFANSGTMGAEAGPVRMAGVEPVPMLIRSPLYFPPSPQREGLAGSHVGLCAGCEHLDGDCQQTVELSARSQRPTGRSRMAWRPVLPSS